MNCAEHISATAQWLFDQDEIGAKTRLKLFRDIITILCEPHLDEADAAEFKKANIKLHRFLLVQGTTPSQRGGR